MDTVIKPQRLRSGDTVAVLSPSWGGPHAFPRVFDLGLENLQSRFGLKIKEFSTARRPNSELHLDPKGRAEDINMAFADREAKSIIASIGGDDSVRILPYLDLDIIQRNPKILMGYSDTTTLTTYLNQQGLVTFNGPSIMAGFAQLRYLPSEFADHVTSILFEPTDEYLLRPYAKWADRYLDWSTPDYDGEVSALETNSEGWQWLQGEGISKGRLFGGCIEVLEFIKGTKFWPARDFWEGRILFFETSEDKPTVSQVKYMLRNYGSMGVLDQVNGILFGRARSYSAEEKAALYRTLVNVVSVEFGRTDLPIIANLDFGHTDPQWIMPLGIELEIDPTRRTLRFTEPAVT